MTYPDGTPQKACIRDLVYRTVAAYWGEHPPVGTILVMAGHEALEVSLLKKYLGWPPQDTLWVDWDKRGLLVAEKAWPGIRTFHGPVHEAVLQGGSYAFLNLDLMGKFGDDVEATLQSVSDRIPKRGVVAYTFSCSRDKPALDHSFQRSMFAGRRFIDPKNTNCHVIRWAGNTARMQQRLGFQRPKLLLATEYNSKHKATKMGVLVIAND